MTMEEMKARLKNYPGAHPNEKWKLEKDLNKCTDKEKAMMRIYGFTPESFMAEGLNRGEVHHILYGYAYESIR